MKEKKMNVNMTDLRWSEIQKVEAMLKEEKIRSFEKYVLTEYLKSLKYGY
jgi:fructose/tagatose bisphosphate aldolase